MKFIVATSGGVDSMVLLDMMVRHFGAASIVVAHFDHGIRKESHEDAQFVRTQAALYGCTFELGHGELGASASEEKARKYRYAFLHGLSVKYTATLVVAHHLDDLVETVALQLMRGTGWRGLTPFGQFVVRPLLRMTKQQLISYAERHGIDWHEDATNSGLKYARNRIRPAVSKLPLDSKLQVAALATRQWEIRREVEAEVAKLVPGPQFSRYFFIMLDTAVREELLRHIVRGRLTRPQLARLGLAVCVAKAGTIYHAGSGVKIHFTTRQFTVELVELKEDS